MLPTRYAEPPFGVEKRGLTMAQESNVRKGPLLRLSKRCAQT